VSWTSSAARRAAAGSRPSAAARSWASRSRLKATSSTPEPIAARSRNQEAQSARPRSRVSVRRRRPARFASSPTSLAERLTPASFSSSSASRAAASASAPTSSAAFSSSRQGVGGGGGGGGGGRAARGGGPPPPPPPGAHPSERESGGTETLPFVGKQEAGPLQVACREAGGGGDLLVGSGIDGRIGLQRRLQRLARQRRELDRLAARGDRLEQCLRLGAEQDQMGEGGWLLERLQQRVLALVAHRLGRLEDEDPPTALEGPIGSGADHPFADRLDQVLGAARREPDQVWVGRGIEQGAAAGVVGILGAGGEDLGGEGAGGGALARPPRAAEEICVRGP
jgi:hypothetical protein